MSTTSTRPDAITVEVIRNGLLAATEEMKADLRKSSYNPIINEMNDFSVGIFNGRAETLAQAPGLPEFVCDIPSAIESIVDDIAGLETFQPGDVYITNDPYANTFHVHDVNVIRPLFYRDGLIGFTGARAHWHDIGGAAASGSLTAREVFEEGLIFRSIRLYQNDEMNLDIMRIIGENNRLPHTVLGDLRAQVGCCFMGEQRVIELVDKYGLDVFQQATDIILDEGEKLALSQLADIPKGVYTAEGCVDNDGIVLDQPLKIKATVTISDKGMSIDLAGSAQECVGPSWSNRNTTSSICKLIFKMLTTPREPANEGHFRMVDVKIPDRSIFNAKKPNATLPGFFALEALIDVVRRALAPAMPDKVNAEDYGCCTPAHIVAKDASGEYQILADTEGGGWGAKPFEDGENGLLFGEVRVIPIEVMESRYPVRLKQYKLREDSGGAGKYRGGLGIVKDYFCLDDVQLNAGFDRQVCPPQGVLGGKAALSNQAVIVSEDGKETLLPARVTGHPVKAGETISFRTGGGGGYGDPRERDFKLIERDVRRGLISPKKAESDYAVVLKPGTLQVDIQRSRQLRGRTD